jgi:hypothetical protein
MARDRGEIRSATRQALETAEIVIMSGLVIAATLTALYTAARWVIG